MLNFLKYSSSVCISPIFSCFTLAAWSLSFSTTNDRNYTSESESLKDYC